MIGLQMMCLRRKIRRQKRWMMVEKVNFQEHFFQQWKELAMHGNTS
jgi:hypothetical protein